jgi:hypothetical protein
LIEEVALEWSMLDGQIQSQRDEPQQEQEAHNKKHPKPL